MRNVDFAYFATTSGAEWERWAGRNVAVSGGAVGLETEPSITYTNLRISARDLTIDQDETVLTLDEDGTVYSYDRATERNEVLWAGGADEGVESLRAVCVFGDRLYLADAASGDLVVCSRQSGDIVGRFDARLEDPVDIVRNDRRLFILDAGTDGTDGRVLTLRRSGMVEPVVQGLSAPVDLAADSSHLYIVEHPEDTAVIRIHDVGHIDSPSIIPTSRTVEALVAAGTDETVTPERIGVLGDQELVMIGQVTSGGDRGLYHFSFEGTEWTLTRRDDFALSCAELVTGPRLDHRRYPNYYAIAGEHDHVYIIDEQQTNVRNPADDRYSAQTFRRFDSGGLDTSWHRLTLGFETLPENSQVVVSYEATNERDAGSLEAAIGDLSATEAETLEAAGIEGPWGVLEADPEAVATAVGDDAPARVEAWIDAAIDFLDERDWSATETANRGDVLLEGVTGRYLTVKLELVGSIDASPQVEAFRAYCPKLTYVRYLPEQFQRSGHRHAFLERYLSVFESEFVDIEADIERISRFFDPEAVPSEYLAWLAEWVALDFDETWPEAVKRAYLLAAPALFKARGTKAGIARRIRLYLEQVDAPDTGWMSQWQRRRLESRRADGWLDDASAAEAFDAIEANTAGSDDGHLLYFLEHHALDGLSREAAEPYTMHMRGSRSFVVFAGPFVSPRHREVVAQLVAEDTPAHAHGRVVEVKHECKLEGASFLGINSTLTSREFVLGTATLGGDTVLSDRGSPLAGTDA